MSPDPFLEMGVAFNGTILLGRNVSCDGYTDDYSVRVQTHVHTDHMRQFDRSKRRQDIFLSPATFDLLVAEYDVDLPHRRLTNVSPLETGQITRVNGEYIQLLSSAHMLGAVQVRVTLESGMKVGYSGDFGWPLPEAMEVDGLIVDSTYGSPDSIREYSQAECETVFVELISDALTRGPVLIKSHRGSIHRALQLVYGSLNTPILAGELIRREMDVYCRYGYALGTPLDPESSLGREVLNSGRYVRFLYLGKGDQWPIDLPRNTTTIVLSGYMSRGKSPVVDHRSGWSFTVGMSNHADFAGTLAYVEATGASHVMVDNSRGGSAQELASELRSRLGLKAMASA
jgi:putative mRNA 3-end processing factor